MRLVTFFFAMSLFGLFANAQPLTVGAPAPEVAAPDQEGQEVRFSEIYGQGTTLIFFYPKAGTPGCTAQACSLRDAFADLQREGLVILGVSGDSPEAQKKFREKHEIPFRLISDADGKVAAAFGVPTIMGIPGRQSFIIRDGKIVWATPKAKTNDHAEEVQAALNSLD